MTKEDIRNSVSVIRLTNMLIGVDRKELFLQLGFNGNDLKNFNNYLIGNRSGFPRPKTDKIELYLKNK
jgi:hypothetical protein